MKCGSIEEVRKAIDGIDNEIVRLIAERGKLVAQAAAFKKSEDGVRDSSRAEKVIAGVRLKAEEYGADPDMTEAVYREMISRFINMEMTEFARRRQG
ncbi:MAG: chorismate mutase [Ruminococcus sp.]|nr:chorismate mutase [Ruminococcus sp.]